MKSSTVNLERRGEGVLKNPIYFKGGSHKGCVVATKIHRTLPPPLDADNY